MRLRQANPGGANGHGAPETRVAGIARADGGGSPRVGRTGLIHPEQRDDASTSDAWAACVIPAVRVDAERVDPSAWSPIFFWFRRISSMNAGRRIGNPASMRSISRQSGSGDMASAQALHPTATEPNADPATPGMNSHLAAAPTVGSGPADRSRHKCKRSADPAGRPGGADWSSHDLT